MPDIGGAALYSQSWWRGLKRCEAVSVFRVGHA